MDRLTRAELEALPTLTVGQADDLKIETTDENGQRVRIWLSRVSEGQVDVETYSLGKWVVTDTYQAR